MNQEILAHTLCEEGLTTKEAVAVAILINNHACCHAARPIHADNGLAFKCNEHGETHTPVEISQT